jgi:hypothetical protein
MNEETEKVNACIHVLTDFSVACAATGELADDVPSVAGGHAVVAAVAQRHPRGRRQHNQAQQPQLQLQIQSERVVVTYAS